jgi:glutathione S-transferase
MGGRTEFRSALEALQHAVADSSARRRHKPPTHPRVLFRDMMTADRLSIADIAHAGLSHRVVERLLSGDQPFTSAICHELRGWLGPRTKVLEALQKTYDHFERFGERPRPAPLADTKENREAAEWYVSRKSHAPHEHQAHSRLASR